MFINLSIFILSYIFILSAVIGYGFLVTRYIPKLKISNNLGYIGLIGLFFLIIYSYISSFFLKHGYLHNSILLIIGFLGFCFFLSKYYKKNSNQLFYLSIVFLVISFASIIYKMHDDFPYYHFPYSYLLTQNNFIIGLGQLNLGFRTPSSIFYLNSIFYLPGIKFYTFIMPAILVLGFTNLILFLKIKKSFKSNNINFITFFNLLSIIFINIFFYRIGEHGTDRTAQILILLLVSEILIFLTSRKLQGNTLSKIYLIIGLVISFKAFYVLYLIFPFVLFIKTAREKTLVNSILLFIKNSFFIPFSLIILLIIINYFFNTGCLLYPVSFTCFENLAWAVSKAEVIGLNNWYEQWSKAGAGPNFRVENPEEYIKFFNWVPNWFDEYFFNKVSDFLLGILFLSAIFSLFFYSSKKKFKKFPNIKLLIIILFILLFEWFYNHPSLRYGGYSLIASLVFLFLSIKCDNNTLTNKNLFKRFDILILITITIFLYRNIDRISNEVQVYSFKPFIDVNFMINDKYFEIQNRVEKKIRDFEACKINLNTCNTQYKDKINIKKIFNTYLLFQQK